MKRRKEESKNVAWNIGVPRKLKRNVSKTADRLGLSHAELARRCMEIGLAYYMNHGNKAVTMFVKALLTQPETLDSMIDLTGHAHQNGNQNMENGREIFQDTERGAE